MILNKEWGKNRGAASKVFFTPGRKRIAHGAYTLWSELSTMLLDKSSDTLVLQVAASSIELSKELVAWYDKRADSQLESYHKRSRGGVNYGALECMSEHDVAKIVSAHIRTLDTSLHPSHLFLARAYAFARSRRFEPDCFRDLARPPTAGDTVSKDWRRWKANPVPQVYKVTHTYKYPEGGDLKHGGRSTAYKLKVQMDKWSALGPLKLTEESPARLLGRTQVKVGDRPQKFVEPQLEWESRAVKHNGWLPGTGDTYFTTDKMMVHGSFETNVHQVQKYVAPNLSSGITVRKILSVVRRHSQRLRWRRIPALNPKDVRGVKINKSAHPGFESYTLGHTKAAVNDFTAPTAYLRLQDTVTAPRFYPAPYALGGREKRAVLKPGEDLKSRSVMMPDDVNALMDMPGSQSFIRMLTAVKGEIFLGFNPAGGGFSRLASKFSQRDTLAMDWSGYDADVTEALIVHAFAMVAACYPNDEFHKNYFLGCMQRFIFKDLVLPGGFVYRLEKGIPSGSPWTSIIGSIVNWIVYVTTFSEMGCDEGLELAIYGDDALAASPSDVWKWHPDRFASEAHRLWGLRSKPSAVKFSQWDGPNPDTIPVFLGQVYPYGLPARPIEDWLLTYLVPNKRVRGELQNLKRSRGCTRHYPFSQDLWVLMEKLYPRAFYDVNPDPRQKIWDLERNRGFGNAVQYFLQQPAMGVTPPPLFVHDPKQSPIDPTWKRTRAAALHRLQSGIRYYGEKSPPGETLARWFEQIQRE